MEDINKILRISILAIIAVTAVVGYLTADKESEDKAE